MRALYFPLWFLFFLLSLLPFWVIYGISDLLYVLLYRCFGYRRKVVRANLRLAFPHRSEKELIQIERGFYRNLCDVMAEFLKMPSISESELHKRVTFRNPEILHELAGNGKSAVAVISHMCNWELGALALAGIAEKFVCLGVYKPLTNQHFDTYFKKMRSRFGLVMIPMRETYRALKSPYPKPVLLNLIADQTPTLSQTEHEALFLGISTPVFLGPEKIATAARYTVLYFSMRRISRGHYEVDITTIASPSGSNSWQIRDKNGNMQSFTHETVSQNHLITSSHLQILESEIMKNPSDWLWSHRRWKHSGKSPFAVTIAPKV